MTDVYSNPLVIISLANISLLLIYIYILYINHIYIRKCVHGNLLMKLCQSLESPD